MTYRARWDVGLAVALAAGLLGVVAGSATVVAAGVVGLAFAFYGYATRPPEATVRVAREVDDEDPAPGTDVTVTVTVRNAADAPLAELRVVDDPPGDLPIVEGTPTHCTSLGAGETDSFEYVVRARRGSHEFGDASVLVRNVSGTVEHHREVELPTTVTCRVGLDELPLGAQTTPYDGRVDADAPGEGVAFHSTRQFRPADPLHRIDWNRFAKDGELTTVQFQQSRAATVVLLVDARRHVRVARVPGEHDAGEYCAFAAARVAGVQLDAGNRVGAAFYGRRKFLDPGAGRDQRLRVGRFLQEGLADEIPAWSEEPSLLADDVDPAFQGPDAGPPADGQAAPDGGQEAGDDDWSPTWYGDGRGWSLSWLGRRLPGDAQVVFCTPLLDDRAANAARQLRARGHEVTVVSPDVTTEETPGGLVTGIERGRRLRSLRADTRVVEWTPEEALAAAVDRSSRGWGG